MKGNEQEAMKMGKMLYGGCDFAVILLSRWTMITAVDHLSVGWKFEDDVI